MPSDTIIVSPAAVSARLCGRWLARAGVAPKSVTVLTHWEEAPTKPTDLILRLPLSATYKVVAAASIAKPVGELK